jgi:predicted ATP-dependent serine protease
MKQQAGVATETNEWNRIIMNVTNERKENKRKKRKTERKKKNESFKLFHYERKLRIRAETKGGKLLLRGG